ncbi:MAG: hypothetical protein WC314_24490 [Vulcanimicrobiota bacterium]
MAFGAITNFGKKVVNTAKDAGGKAVDTAKDVGGKAVDTAKDVGGKAVDTAKDVGGKAFDKAKDIGGDAVNLSKEALEFSGKQQENFANGLLEWGKGSVDTVVNIAKNPVESAKAVGKLATNPVLNPVVGTAVAAVQGKNPVEAFKDGATDLKDIGVGLYDDYKKVYQEHGIAGLAGNLAPDVAIAVLSGGGGTAAKTGGTAAAKGVAKEVAKDVAGEAAEGAVKRTGRDIAKDIVDELKPDEKDLVDKSRGQNEDRNIWSSLLDMFS